MTCTAAALFVACFVSAAPPDEVRTGIVRGEVVEASADGKRLTIRDTAGSTRDFTLPPTVRVTVDGKTAKPAALSPGGQASVTLIDGRVTRVSVAGAKPPAEPDSPAEPRGGKSAPPVSDEPARPEITFAPAKLEADRTAVLEGVSRVSPSGTVGPVFAFGPQSVPVVLGETEEGVPLPMCSVARLGAGRLAAFGHDAYITPGLLDRDDTGKLLTNLIAWATGDSDSAKPVAVRDDEALIAWLTARGIAAEKLAGPLAPDSLGRYRVVVANALGIKPDEVAAYDAYVRGGGGLIAAGSGWVWFDYASKPGENLATDFAANRVFTPAGIVWSMGSVPTPKGSDAYLAPRPPLVAVHAGAVVLAVATAAGGGRTDLDARTAAKAEATLARSLAAVPANDTLLLPSIDAVLARVGSKVPTPTPRTPVSQKDSLARMLVTLQVRRALTIPPDKIQPYPAAAAFPGVVPAGSKRVTQTVAVDGAVPGWQSTGLYAPPGEVLTVKVPPEAAGRKLAVRIGCHSDANWHLDKWTRPPEISRVFPVAGDDTKVANAFGGLVYVEVQGELTPGEFSVEIAGAVPAPYFRLGETDLSDWRAGIRDYPAPWAELACDRVIITVPSEAIRRLDFPDRVMEYWVQVLDACADLAARPRERNKPERIVPDVQVSLGDLHSGYPVMTGIGYGEKLASLDLLRTGDWGCFHELGHNHQEADWTFAGTGEVTCNLFAYYAFDAFHPRVAAPHPDITLDKALDRERKYVVSGRNFETWKADPFLALIMYRQLQQAFGWDAYKKVFAEYRALPEAEHPKTDDEKRDQWMVRFSKTVGRNLGPFFDYWGVPTSAAAKQQVANLPAWMPPGR